ncbi:MAG: hypothetical protein JNK48_06625, partial [Bryobacterales bacterium]|nr:hypothetical protein [Bryobacterales bacterium]
MRRLPLYLFLFALLSPAQTSYVIETVAGGEAGAHTVAIEDIRGTAVDGAGNLYVSDAARHRVVRIGVSGEMAVVAGTGKPGFSGDGGPGEGAELNQPYGLALDSAGNLFIADLQNARVRKVDMAGRISTVAGGGVGAVSLTPADATGVALKAPRNVAVDTGGNLYISDFLDHRVLRVSGGRLAIFAGNGLPGAALDSVGATVGAVSYPAGVHAAVTGEIYVADSGNHAIRRISGGAMTRVAVQESASFLHLPVAVCTDPVGNLYAASTGYDQVIQINRNGSASVLAKEVRDITCDGLGNVYVAAGGAVRRVTSSGKSSLVVGAALRFRGEGSLATHALLYSPMDVKADAGGALYIADAGNHRIRKVAAGVITTVAGDGEAGFGGDNGPAAAARLFRPQGVAVDKAGNLYIADTQNHRIRRVTPDGKIATVAGTGVAGFNGDSRPALETQLDTPSAVSVDGSGVLLVADTGNHRIRRLTGSGFLVTIAGTGGRGFSGDGEAAYGARLDTPVGLAFDGKGDLLVSDQGNRRIRKITAGGTIGTVVSNAGLPGGLAVGAGGIVYYSDQATSSVLTVDSGGTVRGFAGRGEAGFSGDGAA